MLLNRHHRYLRGTAAVALLCVVVSGCSWFRQKVDYQSSPESRPLEVPPDLDLPATDPAMSIPAVAASGNVSASATAAPFLIDDSVDSAWRRLGLALARIEGVEIAERAQALAAYNVRFGGEEFLLRIVADGAASRVEAVDSAGKALSGGAAGRLLAQLKTRLG